MFQNESEEVKKNSSKSTGKRCDEKIVLQKDSVIGSNNSLTLRNRSLYRTNGDDFGSTASVNTTGTSAKRIRTKPIISNENNNKRKKVEINDGESSGENVFANRINKKTIHKTLNDESSSTSSKNNTNTKPEVSKVLSDSIDLVSTSTKMATKNNSSPAVSKSDKNIDSIIGKLTFKIGEKKIKEAEKVSENENEDNLSKFKANHKSIQGTDAIEPKEVENENINEKNQVTNNNTAPNVSSIVATSSEGDAPNNYVSNISSNASTLNSSTEGASTSFIFIDDEDHKNSKVKENLDSIKQNDLQNSIACEIEEKIDVSKTIVPSLTNNQNLEKPKVSISNEDDDVLVLEDESSIPMPTITPMRVKHHLKHRHHQHIQQTQPFQTSTSTTSQSGQYNSFVNRQRNSSQSIMYTQQNQQSFNHSNVRTTQMPMIPSMSAAALISNHGIIIPSHQQNYSNFYTPGRIHSQTTNNHSNHLLLLPANYNSVSLSSNALSINSSSSNSSRNNVSINQQTYQTPQQQPTNSTPSASGSAFKLYNNFTHD